MDFFLSNSKSIWAMLIHLKCGLKWINKSNLVYMYMYDSCQKKGSETHVNTSRRLAKRSRYSRTNIREVHEMRTKYGGRTYAHRYLHCSRTSL